MANSGALTLTNVTFERNFAENAGGLFNSIVGTVTLDRVMFTGNAAGVHGGGMVNDGAATLENVIFEDNLAGEDGGGLWATNFSPTVLADVTFLENKAARGGGMHASFGDGVSIQNTTFTRNWVNGAGQNQGGGGLFIDRGAPVLTDVRFLENTAARGGGVRIAGGNAELRNIHFLGNLASSFGGGVYVSGGMPRIVNAVFHNNSATTGGGGLYAHFDSEPVLLNSTLSRNFGGVNGGGIQNASINGISVINSIVWGNTAENGTQIFNSASGSAMLHYCLHNTGPGTIVEGGGFACNNCVSDGPFFIDEVSGDLRLMEGSSAIDAGDPGTDLSLFPGGLNNPVDLDNPPRVFGPRIDMGAYEWQPPADEIFRDRFEK